jgi:tRNA(Ile)-lysidine synthase
MRHFFEDRLAAVWPPRDWLDATVLLAVSGGADSMALLRAMKSLKTEGEGRIVAAHVNHRLRGRESDDDEAFVVGTCKTLGIDCEVSRIPADRLSQTPKDGLEAAARELRYDLLAQTAGRNGARFIVTAHTADDQAETILHNILRGAGIGGLAGMTRARGFFDIPKEAVKSDQDFSLENSLSIRPSVADSVSRSHNIPFSLMRPLLDFRRHEIETYLKDIGQAFRRDSSNDDARFTRNRIRRRLLPQLAAEYNSGIVEALLRLGKLAAGARAVIEPLVDDLFENCVIVENESTVYINSVALIQKPSYLIGELLLRVWRTRQWPMQAMGYEQWELLKNMMEESVKLHPKQTIAHTFPGNIKAETCERGLCLSRRRL